MAQKNKRILIFNVNWLGDVLFSTAAIRNIRYNFPDAFIACIVPSRCYQILKDNPHLNEVIIFDERDRHKGILSKLSFVKFLRSKGFDTVFLLHRSFSRALICRLAGIPERIGHTTKKRAFLLTKKIAPPEINALHRIDYYLSILEKSGFRIEDRHTDFYFNPQDREFVESFLKKKAVAADDFVVVMNTAGNWAPKRWIPQYWADLADKLIRNLAAKVIFTGSTADLSLVKNIQSRMREKPIIACAVFNLKQLGALCRRADVFVSADTGPLHIANAVGAKKIIALFGPTHPGITGPYPTKNVIIMRKDVGCKIPCYIVHCKDKRCMAQITPDEVFSQIERLRKDA
ncbi:MAG: glycosyltransferase family 9 protein [Deltaproteobacteria bacterium]